MVQPVLEFLPPHRNSSSNSKRVRHNWVLIDLDGTHYPRPYATS